jgi:hypothetical protein
MSDLDHAHARLHMDIHIQGSKDPTRLQRLAAVPVPCLETAARTRASRRAKSPCRHRRCYRDSTLRQANEALQVYDEQSANAGWNHNRPASGRMRGTCEKPVDHRAVL